MIKGIIFDVDGTTLSTLEDIQNSLNIVLSEYGLTLLTVLTLVYGLTLAGFGSKSSPY